MQIDIQLLDTALSAKVCEEWVGTADAGGVTVFIGTVRNHTGGKKVLRLDFESYAPMAIKEMEAIANQAIIQFSINRISIHHRVGSLAVGEIAVVIAVGAAHRDAAFDACRYAIDTLKQTVPIWKKEFFEDGNVWVAAHP